MGFFDLHEPEDGQDRFFLYAMIVLPFLSSGAYMFDAWYHFTHHVDSRTYEGLLSTIVIVFNRLQYCAPIDSRKLLAIYHVSLCIINQAATIGYLLYSIKNSEQLQIIFYCGLILLDFLFTIGLIYCRVIHNYNSHILVENKHLFHFMSRLEVILTIFIPVYWKIEFTSLTRNIIGYFLLFDFFSDSYSRFQGVWIKSALYLFATCTTISVATEWFYFNHHAHIYEEMSLITELIATALCDTIIILQFFPFHFMPEHVTEIARVALEIKRKLLMSNTLRSFSNQLSSKVSDKFERVLSVIQQNSVKDETRVSMKKADLNQF